MNKLVQAAEAYAGTPWLHMGRDRRGMDCIGLLWRAYADCGVVFELPRRYGRDPFAQGLGPLLAKQLGAPVWRGSVGACRVELLQPGDIVLMSPSKKPRHVALVADDEYFGKALIHADGTRDMQEVCRLGLGALQLKQIVEIYRRPIE